MIDRKKRREELLEAENCELGTQARSMRLC
jgi:hypothetical protein